jgi:hypothetical protein
MTNESNVWDWKNPGPPPERALLETGPYLTDILAVTIEQSKYKNKRGEYPELAVFKCRIVEHPDVVLWYRLANEAYTWSGDKSTLLQMFERFGLAGVLPADRPATPEDFLNLRVRAHVELTVAQMGERAGQEINKIVALMPVVARSVKKPTAPLDPLAEDEAF